MEREVKEWRVNQTMRKLGEGTNMPAGPTPRRAGLAGGLARASKTRIDSLFPNSVNSKDLLHASPLGHV